MTQTIKSSNLGYPRIGEKREWKRSLEKYWAGKLTTTELLAETKALRLSYLEKQQASGLSLIPVGDFSLYDHVLDTSVMFGVFPKRFGVTPETATSVDTYFNIARGTKDAIASEMTKWFNTNYHYIVPELEDAKPYLVENRPLKYYKEAKAELGIEGKPVILGPITFLRLGKEYTEEHVESTCSCGGCGTAINTIEKASFKSLLAAFLPLYIQLVEELVAEGVQYIQFDEPILTTDFAKADFHYFEEVYGALKAVAPETKLILQTYFDAVPLYEEIIALPVDAIGLDFVNDYGESFKNLQTFGFPQDKELFAGIIDGRNIWRSDLVKKKVKLQELLEVVPAERLTIQPSNSLLHVPVTVKNEEKLEKVLKDGLAFADEKLVELVILVEAIKTGGEAIEQQLIFSQEKVAALNTSPLRNNKKVQQAIADLATLHNERASQYDVRIQKQHKKYQFPLLPTTTIGSFPQSPEVRQKRAQWLKKEITQEAYDAFIEEETARWITIQEELDIDVLVHGEFERNDMVEYFGEKLTGFVTTQFGWVQSYGSRAVKPPLVYGDVEFLTPITVKESVYAQSLTARPVKGMLTAPITIINWSFVRDDIARNDVANQIGLALRQEVKALETAGIGIIQVDEPALREGLPLQKKRWGKYLADAVYSFKLTTTGVNDETQIHTHMCYAEFDDIIETISQLDADVISIEASRSHGEIIQTFEHFKYDKEIGLGVYDIHSPRIPTEDEIRENIERALQVIPAKQFWINPDCGLKTRKEAEVIAALKHMVSITKEVRQLYKK